MVPSGKYSHSDPSAQSCDHKGQESKFAPWTGTGARMSHHGTSQKKGHEPENPKSDGAKIWKLSVVLGISIAFFTVEISIGFKTGALALIADAFHYLNDIVSYIIALVATQPMGYTFAYRRAEILGAFFNASFLIALALSILLQSIERFIYVEEVDHPLWVMIVGCCGLVLNVISILVVHEHAHGGHSHGHSHRYSHGHAHKQSREHSHGLHSQHHHARHDEDGQEPKRNLGLLGVIVHLFGDDANNVGVIIAAAVMWKLSSPKRFYADPAVSLVIAMMIFLSAIPLAKQTSRVLMEAAPEHINPQNVKEDLMTIPGVISTHDLHLWHLTENEILASVRVRAKVHHIEGWWSIEKELRKCFAAQGVTQITISPEFEPMGSIGRTIVGDMNQSCSWFPTWFVTHSHRSTISTDRSKA
uniref:Cation diffusion facilitator family transporter n=1 Tax=Kwoniella bestiolae CBS 10118 TaxID=1296100 RepID=A0A1B9G3V4_9TREE|nr:hypothetical protein I302_05496 [Kwoniella bestiolae CBS 10118]OCF25672.1 hypothetical protein I302_05496 [Kwoniella bestiolae CBS 10118]